MPRHSCPARALAAWAGSESRRLLRRAVLDGIRHLLVNVGVLLAFE